MNESPLLNLSLSLSNQTDRLQLRLFNFFFFFFLFNSTQLMADNSNSTVYIGNLDERVSDRVLYDILIQAGRLVDLYIPRDKDTDKPKGYAFAQYESQEIAQYAVNLFSGLVTLYRRTLKFAISGQDKSSLRPDKSSLTVPISSTPTGTSSLKSRPYNAPYNSTELSSPSPRFSEHKLNYAQVPSDKSMQQPNGYRSYHDNTDYNYSRRVFGAALDSVSRGRSGRYETRNSVNYNTSY